VASLIRLPNRYPAPEALFLAPPFSYVAPANRTLMLAVANLAAAFVFIGFAMVEWRACLPMLAGAILGGFGGAAIGKRLSARVVRIWTLLVTAGTTILFFARL
jgi:uncharacterized membrane protein YfcA